MTFALRSFQKEAVLQVLPQEILSQEHQSMEHDLHYLKALRLNACLESNDFIVSPVYNL